MTILAPARQISFLITLGVLICLPVTDVLAATVWTGPTILITNRASSNPALEINQDRMTPNVWITRAGSQGIYNAKTEGGYIHFSSPADTEWAEGLLANHASLTYTNWEGLFGGPPPAGSGPPSLIGKDLVVHLKTDDIYLSLKFQTWGGFGGGFSYIRSTPGSSPAPNPPTLANPIILADGSFRFTFTTTPGFTFSVLASSNVAAPLNNWSVAGSTTEGAPGQYQFTDPGAATNSAQRFYRARWP